MGVRGKGVRGKRWLGGGVEASEVLRWQEGSGLGFGC